MLLTTGSSPHAGSYMYVLTSAFALVACHTECNPMTKSYVMTSGGSLHVNTTLTVGSHILDIFPIKIKFKKDCF